MKTTMPQSRHIFVQVDTESLIGIYQNGGTKSVTDYEVREHSVIYDQGSMALGNPIVNFAIGIEAMQDIYFTILPLKLFSFDTVYFTEFKVEEARGVDVKTTDFDKQDVSFSINTGASVEDGGYVTFCLKAKIKCALNGDLIPINIDPVLRVIQR